MGDLKLTNSTRYRTRERTSLVAEQLRFHKRFYYCAAVYLNEGSPTSITDLVEQLRGDALTRACLPQDQDSHVACSDLAEGRPDARDLRALPQEIDLHLTGGECLQDDLFATTLLYEETVRYDLGVIEVYVEILSNVVDEDRSSIA